MSFGFSPYLLLRRLRSLCTLLTGNCYAIFENGYGPSCFNCSYFYGFSGVGEVGGSDGDAALCFKFDGYVPVPGMH